MPKTVSPQSTSQRTGSRDSKASLTSNASKKSRNSITKENQVKALISDNEELEIQRFSLQEEVLSKNENIDDLQANLEKMKDQMLKICHENSSMASKLAKSSSFSSSKNVQSEMKNQLMTYVTNAEKLSCGVATVEAHLAELRYEMECLKKQKKLCDEMSESGNKDNSKACPCDEDPTGKKLKKLQTEYSALRSEYCRKERDCQEMAERMQRALDSCKDDKDRAVNEALKRRADEMVAEITEQKIFIKELQEQVDLYRDKFMKAQEKVEHQKYLLENLEISNQNVELQINDEISKIKEKFQSKLSELCPYPKMYEESRLELEEAKEKVSTLTADLKTTMAALCRSKCELKTLKEAPDESIEKKYQQLQCEVELMKKKYCNIKSTKDCLEEKLANMKKDLEDLRKDSSKIITTTKCCAEKNRKILHQHINSLEVELAQCRASATISLSEKEETIQKMKDQLAALCTHFTDCKGQIKQLKNQVTYLTNQRHKIRPSDLNKIDCCFPDLS